MKYVKFKYISIVIGINLLSSCNNEEKIFKKEQLARLDHTLTGCFSSEVNKLKVYKLNNYTYASLEKNNVIVHDVMLSPLQIAAFELFVEELTALQEQEGCTTVETYFLTTKNNTIKKTDGGCNWNGFSDLEASIFQ